MHQPKNPVEYKKIALLYKGYATKLYLVQLTPDPENTNPNLPVQEKCFQVMKKTFYDKKPNQPSESELAAFYHQFSKILNFFKSQYNSSFTEILPHKRSVCMMMDVMVPLNQIQLVKYQDDIQCLFSQMVQAIASMHANGIIHRDVKPSNIMITKDGILKLGDFGISRKIEQIMTPNISTKNYRAPEIFFGTQNYGFEMDVWALGCTLVEMYIGQILFIGKSEIEILVMIANIIGNINLINQEQVCPEFKVLPNYLEIKTDNHPRLKDVLKWVPTEAILIIEQLLQINPRKRLPIKILFKLTETDYYKKGLQMKVSNELQVQIQTQYEKIIKRQ